MIAADRPGPRTASAATPPDRHRREPTRDRGRTFCQSTTPVSASSTTMFLIGFKLVVLEGSRILRPG